MIYYIHWFISTNVHAKDIKRSQNTTAHRHTMTTAIYKKFKCILTFPNILTLGDTQGLISRRGTADITNKNILQSCLHRVHHGIATWKRVWACPQ